VALYAALVDLKAAVNLATDGSKDAILLQIITDCSAAIDDHCQRTFAPATATRTYYASQSSILWIDDLISITSLTRDGIALVNNTDYEARPLNLDVARPHYDRLIRLSGRTEIGWSTSQNPRPRVAITGSWGYAAAVPGPVARACLIMAARTWDRQKNSYANQGGLTEAGLSFVQSPKPSLDADCCKLLETYVKMWSNAE
jgi:hypothetical protein